MTTRRASALAFALTLLAFAHGVRFGTFTASGADSYGYVSEADLWLHRTLVVDQPLHDEFTWRWANWTLAPLGYRPGDAGGTMVPIYSPGLPLLMAAFKAVGGEMALYLVVPLLGALAVWLTYRLGVRFGDSRVALLASLALLVSPIFLTRMVWPMSDVPAMAFWLAAIVAAIEPSMRRAALAGVLTAAAILIRPNLVPLTVLVGMLIVMHRARVHIRVSHVLVFVLTMLPGPIVVAIVNNHLYGSPLMSGYGTVGDIYSGRNFVANVVRYSTWLVEAQTPFILLAVAAPLLLRRAGRSAASRLSAFALIFFAGVLALYLWYMPYDDREYLRFLLPAYPLLLAAAAAGFDVLVPNTPRARSTAFAAAALVLALSGVWQGREAFLTRGYEQRYRAAARMAATLPENALFLCNLHSGSIRYYAHRLTLRYEWLAPDVYVTALDQVRKSGRPLFVVLDESERNDFRARYTGVADVSWLDRPPTLIAAKRVFFYQLWPL